MLYNALQVSLFRRRWRHKILKFAAEIYQNAKKSETELCQILRIVTIYIVINSTRVMGIRVAISCRYRIASEVMLLFSSVF